MVARLRRLRGTPASGVQALANFDGDDRRVTTLSELARAGDAIAQTSSKSEKVRLLAQFLAATAEDELAQAARYFGGRVFPAGDQRTLQVGGAAFSTVLRQVSGSDDAAIRAAWPVGIDRF